MGRTKGFGEEHSQMLRPRRMIARVGMKVVRAVGSLLTTHLEIRGQEKRVWESGEGWGIDLE